MSKAQEGFTLKDQRIAKLPTAGWCKALMLVWTIRHPLNAKLACRGGELNCESVFVTKVWSASKHAKATKRRAVEATVLEGDPAG